MLLDRYCQMRVGMLGRENAGPKCVFLAWTCMLASSCYAFCNESSAPVQQPTKSDLEEEVKTNRLYQKLDFEQKQRALHIKYPWEYTGPYDDDMPYAKFKLKSDTDEKTSGIGVELPGAFLGSWNVKAIRQSVSTCNPNQELDTLYPSDRSADWSIFRDPQLGYLMVLESGIRCKLRIDKTEERTAVISFDRAAGPASVREQIVLRLNKEDGRFIGLERIMVLNDTGIPQTRITYSLSGIRHGESQ